MSLKYTVALDGGFYSEKGPCKLRVADILKIEIEAELMTQTIENLVGFSECLEIFPQFWKQKHHLWKRSF
ncbi:hypothetical protein CON22_24930 [Bacillus cereus]|nr:hypothetical protein CON22_24930 [Bacillus cereus]